MRLIERSTTVCAMYGATRGVRGPIDLFAFSNDRAGPTLTFRLLEGWSLLDGRVLRGGGGTISTVGYGELVLPQTVAGQGCFRYVLHPRGAGRSSWPRRVPWPTP